MTEDFRFGMGKARPREQNKVKAQPFEMDALGRLRTPVGPTAEELLRSIPDKDAKRTMTDLFLCRHGMPEKSSAKTRDLYRASGMAVEPIWRVFQKRGAVSAIDLPEIAGSALTRIDLPVFSGAHRKITRFVKATDFRDHEFLGTVDELQAVEVQELGEIPVTPIAGINSTMQIKSCRARIPVTRRQLFDGALNYLQIPQALGRAAMRKEARDTYALLESNPTLADGQPLFGGDNDVTAEPHDIGAGLSAFRAQKTALTSNEYTLSEPKFFVAPASVEETARKSLVDMGLDGQIELIVTPLVTKGYLLADPDIEPVLIRLALNEQPQIETRSGSNVIDGIVIDLFHDFKIGAISRVGAVRISNG